MPERALCASLARHARDLESLARWSQTSGAPLLVVDPFEPDDDLRTGMAVRGVHLTWARSALDGLVEFGRTSPRAVIVSPYLRDVPAVQLISALRRHSPVTVIAALATDPDVDAGAMVLAGARAVVNLPYATESVWAVLHELDPHLDDHATVRFGDLELDATAYTVRARGRRIPDPPLREFELLRFLMLRAPEIVGDDELAIGIWGAQTAARGNTLAVHVRRLRKRLEGAADIRRVRGRGYALTLD